MHGTRPFWMGQCPGNSRKRKGLKSIPQTSNLCSDTAAHRNVYGSNSERSGDKQLLRWNLDGVCRWFFLLFCPFIYLFLIMLFYSYARHRFQQNKRIQWRYWLFATDGTHNFSRRFLSGDSTLTDWIGQTQATNFSWFRYDQLIKNLFSKLSSTYFCTRKPQILCVLNE